MKREFTTLALLSALNFSSSAFSITPSDAPLQDDHSTSGIVASASITGQTRYMQIEAKDKKMAQGAIILMGTIDFNGVVELHALAQTGNAYNLGYNNIYNSASNLPFDDEHFKLRRLFLRKKLLKDNLIVDLGAMGNRASIAKAGKLSDIGWIDGARVELKTKLGNVMVTGGSLNSNEANVIDRVKEFELNYFEITVSREMFKHLMIESGIEVYNDEAFVAAAGKYDIEIATGRVINLVADALVNAHTGGPKVGVGVDNLLALFTNKFSSVRLSASYMYTSLDIGQRGQLTNTFTALGAQGHAAIFSVTVPVVKKYEIVGFASARITPDGKGNLYEIGLKKTINIGKKKK